MTLQHLVFFLSGAASLVYEVLWARELALVFGYTVYSISTVLAAIMAGFALGSGLGSGWVQRTKEPWRLYGRLELGVALFAAPVPWAFSMLMPLIEAWGLPPLPVRFVFAFCLLTPASLLMGATFPVLSRAVRMNRDPGRAVGGLYAANLLGACFGAGASAFLGLAFLGVSRTYAVALAMSVAAGVIALATPLPCRREEEHAIPCGTRPPDWAWECAALFVSGLCGMAFEVIWTRLLVPSFSNSSYGFASVLVVFLAGSGLGSAAAARLRVGSRASLGGALVLCAVLGLLAYSVFELTQLLQIRFVDFKNAGVTPMIAQPLAEAFAVLLPVALLQGAMLPLAVRSCGAPGALGRLYAWNTLGAIAGSLAAGFWWIPYADVQKALLITVLIGIAAGTALLWSAVTRPRRPVVLLAAGICTLFAWLRLGGEHMPYRLMLDWGVRTPQSERRILYYREDIEAAVMADARGGLRFLVINGAGASGYDNVTKLLAHIPLVLHPAPRRALVICFGMGTTFRSAMSHPVKVDAVELVPSVLEAFPFFYPDAAALASDPRARLMVNDGRNHLLVEKDGYDVIMMDPQPPLYAAGTANLYNRDFFALARKRLKPHGLLAVWLPTCPESEFNMVVRSFADAMPHVQFWRSRVDAPGLILLGSPDPIRIDRKRAESRLKALRVRKDLLEFNQSYAKAAAFWDLYLGPGESFADRWGSSPPVTDDHPRIEYPYFRSLSPSYYRNPKVLFAPVLPSAH